MRRLVCLIGLLCAFLSAPASARDYSPPLLYMSFPWGEDSSKLGFDNNGQFPANAYSSLFPRDFVVDGQGDLYVIDLVNRAIKVFDSKGRIKRLVPASDAFAFAEDDLLMSIHLDGLGDMVVCRTGKVPAQIVKFRSNNSIAYSRQYNASNVTLDPFKAGLFVVRNTWGGKFVGAFDVKGKAITAKELHSSKWGVVRYPIEMGATLLIEPNGHLHMHDYFSAREYYEGQARLAQRRARKSWWEDESGFGPARGSKTGKVEIMALPKALEGRGGYLEFLGYTKSAKGIWVGHCMESRMRVYYILIYDNKGILDSVFRVRDDTTSPFRRFKMDETGTVYEMDIQEKMGLRIWKYEPLVGE